MTYTQKIQFAIKFAIKTHEVYQHQKRKGKNIAYIVHPLTVGIILSTMGADEDVIVAGILHDTIEDSIEEKKVSKEMITERFGKNVADLVLSVTEQNKELPWEERKREAYEHIKTFSHESLLLKSADIISNASELIDDYKRDGVVTFERFNSDKEKILTGHIAAMEIILEKWPESPLAEDLQKQLDDLKAIARQVI